MDLVFDANRHGVTLKFLTVVEEGSHNCIDIMVGRRMTARDVVRALDEAVRRHAPPAPAQQQRRRVYRRRPPALA